MNETIFLGFFSSLLEGNKEKCCEIVTRLLEEKYDIRDIYLNLFQKSMYGIGKKWEKQEITIATEHIASQIIKHLMSIVAESAPKKTPVNKTIVLFCIDKEFHELGIKMISDIFEINGWTSYFVGANTPTKCILSELDHIKPELIGISFNYYMNLSRFFSAMDAIKEQLPDVKVIVGGQALAETGLEVLSRYSYTIYLRDLEETEKYILSF